MIIKGVVGWSDMHAFLYMYFNFFKQTVKTKLLTEVQIWQCFTFFLLRDRF